MIIDGRRLWIDSHIHIRGWSDDGGGESGFDIDDIFRVMDADAAHLVWIISYSFPGIRALNDDPAEGVPKTNEGQLRLVQDAPAGRIFGSVAVHPGAIEASLEAIDIYAGEHGFVQVGEVLGYSMGFELDSQAMVKIARKAAEHDIPVQCHCSTAGQPQGEQMRQTINLARMVPEAKIIAAHAIGGTNSYTHITAAEVYAMMGGENLWLEIRDFNNREWVREAVERLGSERLIAGTDWIARGTPPFPPYGILFPLEDTDEMPYPCSVASLEGFLRESGCDDEDVANIAARNSIDLFGLAYLYTHLTRR
ncbi:MAG: amidohydrolase family protein [Armatimonadota bacterium]